MANNRFNNSDNEFDNIFDNKTNTDEFEDVFSNSASTDKYEDISSSSETVYENISDEQNFQVKYNSAVQNRRRQEIQYDNIGDVYGDLSSDESEKKEKKTGPAKKIIIAILCVSIVALSCLGVFGYQKINKLLSSFDTDEQLGDNAFMNIEELEKFPDHISVLLVGVDERETEIGSRSDTVILATIDNKNKQIKLTSFLRDSYVEIAGKDYWSKLNSSYFHGGIQTLSDTLELRFVNINFFCSISIIINHINIFIGIRRE